MRQAGFRELASVDSDPVAIKTFAKNLTGSFSGGLYALAFCALVSSVISLFWLHIPRHVAAERATAPAE